LVNSGNEKVEFFLDEEKFGQEYKAILIHGALAGTFWGEPVNLWCRILDNEDYRKNFLKMEEKGYNIMIRGHDHEQNCVSVQYKTENKNEKNIKNHLVTPKNAMKEIKKVELTRNFNDRYIINPGSFYGGYYAILDTNIPGQKIPVINFYKLKPEDVY